MTARPDDQRVQPRIDDELTMLVMFLDYLRDSVAAKLDDVDEGGARTVAVPSGTNLLGLIQHLTMAEQQWFGHVFAGSDDPVPTRSMEVDRTQNIREVLDRYRAACATSNSIVNESTGAMALAARGAWGDAQVNLRWILLHMIEETARHAGHADILREQLDGQVGR